MRILFVHPLFFSMESGVANAVKEVIRGLSKKGFLVDVLTTDAFSDIREENKCGAGHFYTFEVSKLLMRSKIYIPVDSFLYKAEWIVRNYDLVHLNEYRSIQNAIVAHVCRKLDVPFLLQPHGTLTYLSRGCVMGGLKRVFDAVLGFRILRDAATVVALNKSEVEQCLSFGVPKKKISVIPNGIDLRSFRALPPRGEFRSKYGIRDNEKIVLYVGRIYWVKGVDVLVKAFARLDGDESMHDLRLVVVGSDDGYLWDAQRLVRGLNLTDRVVFTGPLYGREKLSAFVDADVFALPSRSEAFPMTLLEAFACGKAVVASNVGGLKSLVLDNKTGLLVDPNDVEQLANSLMLLLNDSVKTRELGLNGKRLVERRFASEEVVEQLANLYAITLERSEKRKNS